jgi:hypothetical protein
MRTTSGSDLAGRAGPAANQRRMPVEGGGMLVDRARALPPDCQRAAL